MGADGVAHSPAAAAFAERLRAFHRGLPAGERPLLEQVLALAAAACGDAGEVEGFGQQEPFSRGFMLGLIGEIGLPALDGASKDAAKMTLKFAPEYTRMKKGGSS